MFIRLTPGGHAVQFFSWVPIAVFAGIANVCYLLGPSIEILIHKLWDDEVLLTGPVLFQMGLTFSVGLALLPALVTDIYWVARIVFAIV